MSLKLQLQKSCRRGVAHMSGLIIYFLLFSLKASRLVIGTTTPLCSNVSISENDILTFFLTNISSHESARPVWDHKTPVNINISFHLRNLVRVVRCFLDSLLPFSLKFLPTRLKSKKKYPFGVILNSLGSIRFIDGIIFGH